MVNCDFCDRLCGTSIEPAHEFASGYIFCLHCVIEHVEDIAAGGDRQILSWSSDSDCSSSWSSDSDLGGSQSEPEPEPAPEERSPKRRRLIGKQSVVGQGFRI